MNLYIIGNGFDMAHGLLTSFSSFKKFMCSECSKSVSMWEEIITYELKDDWSDLEKSFGFVNYDYVKELCSVFLADYGAENWSDSYHYDYQYEISQYLDLIINSDTYLRKWLASIYKKCDRNYFLDSDSMYLTFNYTNLLEETYGIDKNNICHIHGDYASDDKLILGHSNPFVLDDIYANFNEDDDVRIIEGEQILNSSKSSSYKNSERLIEENEDFFNKCNLVESINIIGHSWESMLEVDKEYYSRISSAVDKDNILVNVVYHNALDVPKYTKALQKFGFKNLNFLPYDDIKI